MPTNVGWALFTQNRTPVSRVSDRTAFSALVGKTKKPITGIRNI